MLNFHFKHGRVVSYSEVRSPVACQVPDSILGRHYFLENLPWVPGTPPRNSTGMIPALDIYHWNSPEVIGILPAHFGENTGSMVISAPWEFIFNFLSHSCTSCLQSLWMGLIYLSKDFLNLISLFPGNKTQILVGWRKMSFKLLELCQSASNLSSVFFKCITH